MSHIRILSKVSCKEWKQNISISSLQYTLMILPTNHNERCLDFIRGKEWKQNFQYLFLTVHAEDSTNKTLRFTLKFYQRQVARNENKIISIWSLQYTLQILLRNHYESCLNFIRGNLYGIQTIPSAFVPCSTLWGFYQQTIMNGTWTSSEVICRGWKQFPEHLLLTVRTEDSTNQPLWMILEFY